MFSGIKDFLKMITECPRCETCSEQAKTFLYIIELEERLAKPKEEKAS